MHNDNLQSEASRTVLVYVRIAPWGIGPQQTDQSCKAWQALGVSGERSCGIPRCFILFWCEHAATWL